MEESIRQRKIAKLLQQDLAEIFQQEAKALFKGVLLSVGKVRVTPDLSDAKVYISVFPTKDSKEIIEFMKEKKSEIRYQLSQRIKNQLRKTPELHFFLDDSIDYEENIDRLLKGGGENPIK